MAGSVTDSGLTWMTAALGSALIFGCVSVNDKIILSRLGLRLGSLSFSIGFGQLLIAALIFGLLGLPSAPAATMLKAVAVGMLWGGGLLLMFWMLTREEVSRVTPVFHTYPVFVALMAVFLLGEELTWMKWVAVALAVGGAVLVSGNPPGTGGSFQLRPMFAFLLLGAFLVACAQLILKTIVDDLSVWHLLALRALGIFIAMSLPTLRPSVFGELCRFVRTWQGAVTIVGIDTIGAFAGNILLVIAMSEGPVSLVSTIIGTRPLFVFGFTVALGWRAAWVLQEKLGRREIAMKLVSASMVVAGLALIATG